MTPKPMTRRETFAPLAVAIAPAAVPAGPIDEEVIHFPGTPGTRSAGEMEIRYYPLGVVPPERDQPGWSVSTLRRLTVARRLVYRGS